MPAIRYLRHCLLILFAIGYLAACKNKPAPAIKIDSGAVTKQVDLLLERGKLFLNTSNDSVPPIYKALLKLSDSTGDKRALVYGEKFECIYYWHAGNHQNAMEWGVKSLSDAEKWKILLAVPDIYLVIGNLNKEKANYPMAFQDVELALKAARELKDTADIIGALGDKAMFTRGWYAINHKAGGDSIALKMQLAALKMSQANVKYERSSIKFYTNVAQAYKDKGDLEKTLQYANTAVGLADKYNRPRSLTYAYCWMGEAWYRHGDHARGLAYLNKALLVAKTIKEPFRTMEIYETMYDCYLFSGDYKNALFYSDNNRRLKDSLQVLTNLKQLGDLQVKYESAQKDKQITLLAAESKMKSNELLWIMISSSVVIIFFLLLFYQYYTIHKQHREIIEKNDVLNDALSKIAFIQSHEMRKPLASILGLINVIKAEDYDFQKECLLNLEKAANELDQKIRSIVTETDVA